MSSFELDYIGQNVSEVSKNVVEIKVDSDTEDIRERAFEECRHLRSIVFSADSCVEAIGFHAFFGCESLRGINIPCSVNFIGHGAFGDCRSLVAVDLPGGLQDIMKETFYFCESLETIKIPSSVVRIGQQAFEGCISLESVKFLSTMGLCKIGSWAFSDCSSLRRFDMPSTVRMIENETFRRCTGLEVLNLPEGALREIHSLAFWRCESLTCVKIPSCVETIGLLAFMNCTSLLSVEMARKGQLAVVEDRVFEGCTSLLNLWLPKTEVQSFSHCTALQSLLSDQNGMQMTNTLASRFDSFPIHGAAYFDGFEFGLKDFLLVLDESDSTADAADCLGMNVFHILALATKQDVVVFEFLSQKIPTELLNECDKNGCTPMDYLCTNLSADTAAVIEFVIRSTISGNIPYLGLSPWREVMERHVRSFRNVGRREKHSAFRRLRSKYDWYARKEALSLLELAVWKARIIQVETDYVDGPIRRDERRINCGADIVILQVISYLQPIE
ncbi:unnamed protein product [Cylindrotheca closterium]|uniref:Uncharacterized protein n=1 Tax=Cylindrotheca closterium TaxID=2856 RepID=A0AAD2G7I1_9STRA|nr:unnamed protein product [Cylindrotheca closterium]